MATSPNPLIPAGLLTDQEAIAQHQANTSPVNFLTDEEYQGLSPAMKVLVNPSTSFTDKVKAAINSSPLIGAINAEGVMLGQGGAMLAGLAAGVGDALLHPTHPFSSFHQAYTDTVKAIADKIPVTDEAQKMLAPVTFATHLVTRAADAVSGAVLPRIINGLQNTDPFGAGLSATPFVLMAKANPEELASGLREGVDFGAMILTGKLLMRGEKGKMTPRAYVESGGKVAAAEQNAGLSTLQGASNLKDVAEWNLNRFLGLSYDQTQKMSLQDKVQAGITKLDVNNTIPLSHKQVLAKAAVKNLDTAQNAYNLFYGRLMQEQPTQAEAGILKKTGDFLSAAAGLRDKLNRGEIKGEEQTVTDLQKAGRKSFNGLFTGKPYTSDGVDAAYNRFVLDGGLTPLGVLKATAIKAAAPQQGTGFFVLEPRKLHPEEGGSVTQVPVGQLAHDQVMQAVGLSNPQADKNVLSFLRESGNQAYDNAQDLHDRYRQMRTSQAAKIIALGKFQDMLPADFRDYTEEIYHWQESPNREMYEESDPRHYANLSEKGKQYFQSFIKPFVDASNIMFRQLGNGPGMLNYVHHIRVKDSTIAAAKDLPSGQTWPSRILNESASGLKKRRFMVAVDEDGNRFVVVKNKDTLMHVHDGEYTPIGRITSQTTALADYKARQTAIRQAQRKSKALYKKLTETAGQAAANAKLVDRLNQRLNDLHDQEMQLLQVDQEDLSGSIIHTKRGDYTLKPATTAEIEANTNLRFWKDAYDVATLNWLQISRAKTAHDFVHGMMEHPSIDSVMRPADAEVPANWVTVRDPRFSGYKVEPYAAAVLDHFSREQEKSFAALESYEKVNDWLRNVIFYNPLIHVPNDVDNWVVAKGASAWASPRRWAQVARASKRTVKAVLTQDPLYLEFLENGANLTYWRHGDNISNTLFKILHQQFKDDPESADKFGRALGYLNGELFTKGLYRISNKFTSFINDLSIMQDTLENMDRHGLSMREAYKRTTDHIPDYVVPGVIGGGFLGPKNSSRLAALFNNRAITMFGPYHYGVLKSYGSMIKPILAAVSKKGAKGGDLTRALDVMAGAALYYTIVYPARDAFYQTLTQDPDARSRRSGIFTIPFSIYKYAHGEEEFPEVVSRFLTLAPGVEGLMELATNRDFFSGHNLIEHNIISQPWKAAEDVGAAAAHLVAPIGAIKRAVQSPQGATRELAALALGQEPNPVNKAYISAEDTELEEHDQHQTLQALIQQVKTGTDFKTKVGQWIRTQPLEDRAKLWRAAKTEYRVQVAMNRLHGKNIPERGWWNVETRASDEDRAQAFYHFYVNADASDRRAMLGVAHAIPGFHTKKFYFHFYQLLHGREKPSY